MRIDCAGYDTDHMMVRTNTTGSTLGLRIVSVRTCCRAGTNYDGEGIYDETEIWLDEDRARKLFNWLAVWLHGKDPSDDE